MKLIFLFLLFGFQASALTAKDLVVEAEGLYADLPASDPEKMAISLRLADLLFDAALEVHGNVKSTPQDLAGADRYRLRSLSLYQNYVNRLSGQNQLRVKFQISRLFAYAGKIESAIPLWRELAKQNQDVLIKRESALHLAEQLELKDDQVPLREALALYKMALPMTEKQSLRSYILYRQAWTYFRMGQTGEAVSQLRASLKLAAKEEYRDLTRDLVLFMSREPVDPATQIKILNGYQSSLKITGLVEDLGESYMTADRRSEYGQVLRYLNKDNETLERAVALLNLNHDQMGPEDAAKEINRWPRLQKSFRDENSEKRSRETLLQLVTYWDGQRRAQKSGYDSLFSAGVDAMVAYFPSSGETKKAVEGWIAANPDPNAQLRRLDIWLASVKEPALELSLHRRKLELARQTKQWQLVVDESTKVESLQATNQRPSRYQRAKALYELGKKDEALPLFVQLSAETGDADKEITKFSQDLTLDILNGKKDYARITELVARWKMDGARGTELKKISDQARFEQAVANNNGESLKVFTDYCLSRQFLPKSCDNAKVLASNLRDQTALIGILQSSGDDLELARQLEVGARFAESAKILEKKVAASDYMGLLKIALFYELEGDMKERDRVLERMVKAVRLKKGEWPDAEQDLVVQTLMEAGRISKSTLDLPIREALKVIVAAALAGTGKKEAKSILLSACGDGGAVWRNTQLDDLIALEKRQSEISFVGKASRVNFEKRVGLLKSLSARADCVSKGLEPAAQETVSRHVALAYNGFADQILTTPVPDGLDAATAAEVKAQIEAMAAPFRQSGENWQSRAGSAAAADRETNLASLAGLRSEENLAEVKPLTYDWQPMLKAVRREPFNKLNFENWQHHLEQKGSARLAGYLRGRAQGLEAQ